MARRRSNAWLILPVLALGIIAACALALFRMNTPVRTISEVTREVAALALHRGESGQEDGGTLGPWWITASSIDPASGFLLDFRVSSGQLHIAAGSAHILVDAERDAFSFQLYEVVVTRVPDGGEAADAYLVTLDEHLLGPIPYGVDIVPDDDLAGRAITMVD
ncbi:MAG: hypothetical protein ACYTF9_00115 [Planctomycetota bacterium]|jgi:hypothetical protein